jgi:acetolactate synthase I/II/III large subunit
MTSRLVPEAAARRLIETLLARGVDTFFGIPGGPVCPIFEAIRLTPGARLIESRDEKYAAFAAATYQRLSGKTPAVVVTAGPGVTNAVTGVASAFIDRIPMLVIAGDVAWATTGGCMAQDSGPNGIDTESMYRSITRLQTRALQARSVVPMALAALDAAEDPARPGPALLIVPLDRSMEPCVETVIVGRTIRLPSASPPASAVARTVRLLRGAGRPLVVLGTGCRGREARVAAMLDELQVPFMTTPGAKGIVSERHPMSLRNGGMAASIWARRYTAAEHRPDVCLALGTDLDDTSIGPTRCIGDGGALLHVDRDARVFARNFPTDRGIVADVGAFADAVRVHAAQRPAVNAAAMAALADARAVPPYDEPDAANDPRVPIAPHRLLMDLQAAVGDDARYITDIGEHMLFALHYLTAVRSDSFTIQLNLGSMASGIAGAIGLAVADPTRRVVCVAGDGGMQMAGMEALVAVRERLPILFVVFNDARYNMVHHGMKQIFGDAALYDMPPIDFVQWAGSFGMPAVRVTAPGGLPAIMVDALLSHGGPALIDARIDASLRIRGGGRVEALQQMSMLAIAKETPV